MIGLKTQHTALHITPAQRRAIFAAGRARGLDADALRGLTPAGSISMLTRDQAARLIDSLNRGQEAGGSGGRGGRSSALPSRRPRRPKDIYMMATAEQAYRIGVLHGEMMKAFGWNGEQLINWLDKRHHRDGRPMTRVDSSADAVAVIELLKGVLARKQRVQGSRSPGVQGECTQEAAT